MSREPITGRVRTTYEFIKAHRGRFSVQALYRVLDVAPNGYCAWFKQHSRTARWRMPACSD